MIYAIHRKAKEHRVVPRLGVYSNHDWRHVEADADGWIPCYGGECPLPEGAKFDYKMRDGRVVCGRIVKADEWWGSPIIAYRPILSETSEPETPEWDGEGLPPVGCECEGEHYELGWLLGTVIYHDHEENVAVLKTEHGYLGFGVIRPIRSEEDRAVEEMAEAIEDCGAISMRQSTAMEVARAIYRAGYRKEEV